MDCCSERLDGFIVTIYHNGNQVWESDPVSVSARAKYVIPVAAPGATIGDSVQVGLSGKKFLTRDYKF